MADTIREFVVSMGFQLDESQERRFISGIEGATLRAKLLGDAIEAMGRAVVNRVGEVATQFEQLYYQAQRIGTSAQSIRAFEYAVSQLGGTVEGANSSLKGFGDFLRNTPGAAGALARQLGIPLKDTADAGLFLLEVGEKLSKMPTWTSNLYRETFHLGDIDTFRATERPGARGLFNDKLQRDSAAGITGDAMKKATEFEQAWRGVWDRIGSMAEGVESKLFTALTEPMQKFGEWLDKNSGRLNDAITKIADSVSHLTLAWVDDLDKVHWDDVAKSITGAANSIAGFVSELTGLMKWLVDFNEKSKDWWILKFLNGTVGGKWSDPFNPNYSGGADAAPFTEGGGAGGAGGGGWLGRAWGGVKSFFGGGGGNKGVGGWWTPERMKYAADRLTQEAGLSDAGAAGLVARWAAVEAPGGPTASNNIGGGHWGIGQWSTARGGPAIGAASFEDQVTHAIKELNTTEARAAAQLRSAHTAAEGAVGASMFERAENYSPVTGVDDQTANTPVAKTLETLRKAGQIWHAGGSPSGPIIPGGLRITDPNKDPLTSHTYPAPGEHAAGVPWTKGPIWDSLNANLPVGPPSAIAGDKNMTSTVNNTIHVSGSDPQSTAAMVGLHLDRSANDLARNLQGAMQ